MNSRPNIILIGMKSSGKTTVGMIVAQKLGLRFTDMDAEVVRMHGERTGETLSFREIFKQHGKDYFRQLETTALQALCAARNERPYVMATGGGLPLAEENRPLLRNLGINVFLDVPPKVLLPRIISHGVPAFFPYPDDPARSLAELLAVRRPIYSTLAHITVACGLQSQETISDTIIQLLENRFHED